MHQRLGFEATGADLSQDRLELLARSQQLLLQEGDPSATIAGAVLPEPGELLGASTISCTRCMRARWSTAGLAVK